MSHSQEHASIVEPIQERDADLAAAETTPQDAVGNAALVCSLSPASEPSHETLLLLLEADVSDFESALTAALPGVRAAWYAAHEHAAAGDTAPGATAAARLVDVLGELDGQFVDLTIHAAGTRLEPEIGVLWADFSRRFRIGVGQQTFAGESCYGAIAVPALSGGSVRSHLDAMADELDLIARTLQLLRVEGSSTVARSVVERLDGNAFLFARHVLREHMTDADLASGWLSMGLRSAWDSLFSDSEGSAQTREAGAEAMAQNDGIAPERVAALEALVAYCATLVQGNSRPTDRSFQRVRDTLSSDDETVAFMSMLDATGDYDAFLTRAPESLSDWLLSASGRTDFVRDEVGYAAIGQAVEEYGTEAALVTLERALAAAGVSPEAFEQFVGNAHETIQILVDDPGTFIGNLGDAVEQGFGQFRDQFGTHLETAFLDWLTGQTDAAGIDIPDSLDWAGFFDLAMQVLGVTPDDLETLARERLGDESVDRIQQMLGYLDTLLMDGFQGLWEHVAADLGAYVDGIIDEARGWLLEEVVQGAVTYVASLASPVGSLVRAIQMAWEVYDFASEKLADLMGLVMAVTDSMHKIATGDLTDAANGVQDSLARGLGLAMDLLARILQVDGVGDAVGEAIGSIQGEVNTILNKILDRVEAMIGDDDAVGDAAAPAVAAEGLSIGSVEILAVT